MTDRRQFLGWDRPVLESTAEYLISQFTRNGKLDMKQVVLALPGRRAIKRLEEMLVCKVETLAREKRLEPAWYPPDFLTLGTLPEQFYELKFPLADDLTQRLAWLHVIDRMQDENNDLLARLLPNPPDRRDWDARLNLGRIISKLHRELAADVLGFSDVVRYCRDGKIESEADRWVVLDKLQKQYLSLLDRLEVWDLQTARLRAIQDKEPKTDKQVVLVGLVDMNRAQKEILKQVEKNLTILVFAPESSASQFDEFGCLIPEAWMDKEISIDDSQIHVVESPDQQAETVLRIIADWKSRFAAEQIVVGVPDSQVVPLLEQRFRQADLQTRHFEGTPMSQTAVFRFLHAVLVFLEERTFRSFAELVRHPDVESYLRLDFPEKDSSGNELPKDLLSELDRYHTKFLPLQVGDDWKTWIDEENPRYNDSFEAIRILWRRLKTLLGEDVVETKIPTVSSPLKEGTAKVERMLDILFQTNGSLFGETEKRLFSKGIELVRNAVRTILDIPRQDSPAETSIVLLEKLSLPDTIRLILTLLQSGNIPAHENPEAVELIGWLEIVMDDAPNVIVTGMNDGFVPSFLTSDHFLPDKVRKDLGIEDNKRRFARDAYSLTVLLETRRSRNGSASLHLVGGRRSAAGDPMLPSRLFFATDQQTIARRVETFFGPMPKSSPLFLAGTVLPGRKTTPDFHVPEARPLDPPLKAMRVTEFAEYIRCPYRYYLKCRLQLHSLSDADEELNAWTFGSLVHDALARFGRESIRNSGNPEEINRFLQKALDELVEERYAQTQGDHAPKPVVAIQAEQARLRLKAFAAWQADWRASGYVIEKVEYAFDQPENVKNSFLEVDGRPMHLKGRIDRIDFNPKTGEWVVFDYKTSDSAADPEKKHRKKNPFGVKDWIDLQLPLYHYLLGRMGFSQKIALGYIALPKDAALTKGIFVDWTEDELTGAVEKAREIVRAIWSNRFEKVDPPPRFSEEFAAICLDPIKTI